MCRFADTLRTYLQLAALLLVLLAASAPLRAVAGVAAPVRVVYSAYLGRSGPYSIACKVLCEDDPPENGVQQGTVSVKFICSDRRGKTRVFFQDVGPEIASDWEAETQDFVGLGRKQIYVTARVRVANQLLLDCDGTKVRTLYENENVMASDFEHVHGKWFPVKTMRSINVRRDSDLGVLYVTIDDWRYFPSSSREEIEQERWQEAETRKARANELDKERRHEEVAPEDRPLVVMVSWLRWNGKEYVLLESGKTRVRWMSYCDYRRKFGLPPAKKLWRD